MIGLATICEETKEERRAAELLKPWHDEEPFSDDGVSDDPTVDENYSEAGRSGGGSTPEVGSFHGKKIFNMKKDKAGHQSPLSSSSASSSSSSLLLYKMKWMMQNWKESAKSAVTISPPHHQPGSPVKVDYDGVEVQVINQAEEAVMLGKDFNAPIYRSNWRLVMDRSAVYATVLLQMTYMVSKVGSSTLENGTIHPKLHFANGLQHTGRHVCRYDDIFITTYLY